MTTGQQFSEALAAFLANLRASYPRPASWRWPTLRRILGANRPG